MEPAEVANEVIVAPKLEIPDKADAAAVDVPEPVKPEMPELAIEQPTLDIAAVNDAFALVGQSLSEFDAALLGTTSALRLPASSGDGITDDMKRAIIATAENTRRLVERSQSGGLVFS